MKKSLKDKWVKALLSGEYKQGRGALKSHGRFCCLGVLRDIVNPDDTRSVHQEKFTNAQRKEYGLTKRDEACLINLNDSSSAGFELIAGCIQHADL